MIIAMCVNNVWRFCISCWAWIMTHMLAYASFCNSILSFMHYQFYIQLNYSPHCAPNFVARVISTVSFDGADNFSTDTNNKQNICELCDFSRSTWSGSIDAELMIEIWKGPILLHDRRAIMLRPPCCAINILQYEKKSFVLGKSHILTATSNSVANLSTHRWSIAVLPDRHYDLVSMWN